MLEHVVPARQGLAVDVPDGHYLRITAPHGQQAADFFAFAADDLGVWLSPPHTVVGNRSVRPRQGDTFLSRQRGPMLDFTDDGADGVHDMLLPPCDQAAYENMGFKGTHANCADNLLTAMSRIGHEIEVVPQPVNFFTYTQVQADGTLIAPPNPVPAGAYVELRARRDLICVVSSCPYDLDLPGWGINAPGGPTDLILEIRPG